MIVSAKRSNVNVGTREHIRGALVHIGQQRDRRDADDALTAVHSLSGLVNRRNRSKRVRALVAYESGSAQLQDGSSANSRSSVCRLRLIRERMFVCLIVG